MIDYHIHTKRCGHAEGEMAEYVEQAIAAGLPEIGFSDHLPFLHKRDPRYTMALEELPDYVEEVERLRARYPKIRIKLGIEADYFPGREQETEKLIASYAFDYVLGSVHFIDGWGFDIPEEKESWQGKDVDAVYRKYFELLRQSARISFFNIIGHSDLVKKFGHRPNTALDREVNQTARIFKEEGMSVEVNTSGLRKPAQEIYPSKVLLEAYYHYGVPIVFGSDAHAAKEVGKDFDQAALLAREVGYQEALIYEGRKVSGRYTIGTFSESSPT